MTAEPDAGVPYDNRAFRYGYGLFETMLVKDGIILLSGYHWERLFEGARALYFDIPKLMNAEWMTKEVLRTVKKNGLEKLCRVRLQLYGGNGGILEEKKPKPGYIIECFSITEETTQLNETGLVLGIAEGVAKIYDTLANYKTTNALVYAIAAQQAKFNKWNDAFILNDKGNIIESTIANIFWVKDEQLYTPPLSEGCVAGVMRRHIIEQVPVIESILDTDTLYTANEVFLTNAIRHFKWVSSIADKTYSNTLTRKIYSQLFA